MAPGAAKAGRRYADLTLENIREMLLMREAARQCDLGYWFMSFNQHAPCAFYPTPQDKLVGRNSGGEAKLASEVRNAEPALGAQSANRDDFA